MAVPTVPLKEKIKIYAIAFLLVLVIYTVIDLYVPIKHYFAGKPMSLDEIMAHSQWKRKIPFAFLIGFVLGRRGVKKQEAKAAQQATVQEPVAPAAAE